jgi:predicted TPR repeat methyltransferase
VQVERGQLEDAAKNLRLVLELDPENAGRPLIAFYLRQLTGEEIDELPPSESVPILFADEPPA